MPYKQHFFAVFCIFFTASCSNENMSPINKRHLYAMKPPSIADAKETEKELILVNSEVSGNGAGLQVKSAQLLTSSIEACLGENMAVVKESMIITNATSSGFLKNDLYKVNSNAIEVAGKDLLSQETENRLSTNSDGLNINYIGAITTVADIVAENCSPANKLCLCATLDDAKKMMARCLPGISPKHELYESVASEFQKACSSNPQQAIASMLASYAFIISR